MTERNTHQSEAKPQSMAVGHQNTGGNTKESPLASVQVEKTIEESNLSQRDSFSNEGNSSGTGDSPIQRKISSSRSESQKSNFKNSDTKIQFATTDTLTPFSPIQRMANKTGLPDSLKSGIEKISGINMSDVKVHFNSSKPAQLQALAYAKGTDIHLGPGQERHLPHEAWHVVQQKQGRVNPTVQLKSGESLNNETGLEREADRMGEIATLVGKENSLQSAFPQKKVMNSGVVQRKIGLEFETMGGQTSVLKQKKKNDQEGQNVGGRAVSDGTGTGIKEEWEINDEQPEFENKSGFKFTADGPNIEYITDAFGEDEAGIAGLRSAVVAIVGHCEKLVSGPKKKKIQKLFEVDSKRYKVQIHNKDLKAHPQANIGVKLGSILELVNFLSGNWKQEDPIRTAVRNRTVTPFVFGEKNKKSGSYSQSQTKQAAQSAEIEGLSPEAQGVLALALSYIRNARYAGKKLDYAKYAAPIMSRTSLDSLYGKLGESDKRKLYECTEGNNYLDLLPDTGLDDDSKKMMYPEGFGDLNVAKEKKEELSVPKFLHELFPPVGGGKNSTDMFSGIFASEGEGGDGISDLNMTEDAKPDLDHFGMKIPTDIGLGDKISGAVVELRALESNVEYKKWPMVAENVGKLIKYLHRNKQLAGLGVTGSVKKQSMVGRLRGEIAVNRSSSLPHQRQQIGTNNLKGPLPHLNHRRLMLGSNLIGDKKSQPIKFRIKPGQLKLLPIKAVPLRSIKFQADKEKI